MNGTNDTNRFGETGYSSRSRIIKSTGLYIHTEFTSALFRFVDDVEFFLDECAAVIQVRSSSRIGYSDRGVNRKRVEDIRAAINPGASSFPTACCGVSERLE